MDYKYDAFISYRHAEKDTLIASEIQKSLERFKIPKALQKKSGKQRFNRVFRDVEELPISSNLSEDLTEALKASEFLIVICSYRTSESDWVKREIETFLELHDYNKQLVLTVLVEGEPDEVIPEVLRHDNITHYLADGTFYCKDEVVEPLAADYRMPLPKARKIELPRLAASMLGCNYDEIIRRRKAYKRTRLLIETALVAVAAIALMIYVGWTFMKIQDALDKAQMNQARYLSSESLKLLEEGDRVGAIQLALAAFEDGNGNARPVTSDAQFALASALGAYSTSGNSYSVPVWRYETNSSIVKFACTDSGDYVMILDKDGILHVWDKKDNKETLIKDDDYSTLDFILDDKGNVIIFNRNYIALYDTATKTQKWKYQYNGNVPLVCTSKLFYYEKSGYVVVNVNTSLVVVNASDGKLVKEIETYQKAPFNEKTDNKDAIFSINSYLINDDFSKLAVVGRYAAKTGSYIFVLDVEKDKWTCVSEGLEFYLNAAFDSDGSITVMRRKEEENNNIPANYLYETSVVLEQINAYGRSVWKTELPMKTRISHTNIFIADYTTADEKKTPALYTVFANRAVIVEKSTGKTINSFDLQDDISWSNLGSKNLELIIRNGKVIWIPRKGSTKYIQTQKFFMDGTNDVYLFGDKKTSFLVEDSSQRVITEYSGNFTDSKFIAFENSDKVGLVEDMVTCGDYLLTYSEEDQTLSGTDLKSRKTLWTSKVPSFKFLLFNNSSSPDNLFVFCLKLTKTSDTETTYSLFKINCANGQMVDANSEFSLTNPRFIRAVNGRVWSKVDDTKEKTVTIYCYNMMDDTVRKTVVDVKEFEGATDMLRMGPSPDGKKTLIYMNASSEDKVYRLTVDCTSGKYTKAECGDCIYTIWNDKGTLFAEYYNDGSIKVFSASGEEKFTKENDQRSPWEMKFNDDQLYVVYGNGDLSSFDLRGNQVMNINLHHGDLRNNDTVEFNFVNGYLFLTAGSYTDIIKLRDKKSISSIEGFLCVYGAEPKDSSLSNAIVVCRTFNKTDGATIGFFHYKTPSRLVEQAKEYLNKNGAKLTDDFKQKYGLQ